MEKYLNSLLLPIKEIKELRNNSSFGNSTIFIDAEIKVPYKSAQNIAIYPENDEFKII